VIFQKEYEEISNVSGRLRSAGKFVVKSDHTIYAWSPYLEIRGEVIMQFSY